jgi:hypothetical protein
VRKWAFKVEDRSSVSFKECAWTTRSIMPALAGAYSIPSHPHVNVPPLNKFTVPFTPEVACCSKRFARRCCHLRGPSDQSGASSRQDPLSTEQKEVAEDQNCKPGPVGADASSSSFCRMAVHGSLKIVLFFMTNFHRAWIVKSSGSRPNNFILRVHLGTRAG